MKILKKYPYILLLELLLAAIVVILSACFDAPDSTIDESSNKRIKILVFSKTKGFRHKSIEKGVSRLKELGKTKNFDVEHSEDSGLFTTNNLNQYNAVVFLSTSGDILDEPQQKAFEQYIKDGGGFMGIHSATDTEYDWPWYNGLVGAYFLNHPKQQKATIEILNKDHPSTSHLPNQWERFDEWYNYKSISEDINVLANLDESTYEGGANGENHPIAWYHEYDGGKAFYTGGGHTDASYDEPLFLDHLYGGLMYVTGEK
ncbi:MAG: ThuA domain-containing protein [Flammeovirgaceae bacterium]|nr:ThuA domain-containing protein [Flammeovirgaceae bacterium]